MLQGEIWENIFVTNISGQKLTFIEQQILDIRMRYITTFYPQNSPHRYTLLLKTKKHFFNPGCSPLYFCQLPQLPLDWIKFSSSSFLKRDLQK